MLSIRDAHKDIKYLNKINNHLKLINIYRTLQTNAECTFFSSANGICTKTDHLDELQKVSINLGGRKKGKLTEHVSDHNGIKFGTKNNLSRKTSMWKL